MLPACQELDKLFIVCNNQQQSQTNAKAVAAMRGSEVAERRRKLNPERALARFEFLEALVRVAKLHYLRASGSMSRRPPELEAMDMLEAVSRLVTTIIVPHASALGETGLMFRERHMFATEVCGHGQACNSSPLQRVAQAEVSHLLSLLCGRWTSSSEPDSPQSRPCSQNTRGGSRCRGNGGS